MKNATQSINVGAICLQNKQLAAKLLRECLAQLTPKKRLLIHLRFWEHKTIAEIANLLSARWEEIDRQINDAFRELKVMLLKRLECPQIYRIA